ncbi:MAG TPA: DUF4386 family protein [Anaerolineaceae bacterium]|nr:DUF4386 family protein [Anaerolineaceae bacterium]
MNENNAISLSDTHIADARWKDLYIVGGICGILTSILIFLAIVIYFIWPYQPGLTSPAEIFSTIQTNPFKGLMSLDFMMVIATFILVPFFLAIYFSTKQANESYALIALVFGLISCVLAFFMRPIAEMFYLSSQYTVATTDAARNQYLAAGEAISALFNGTAWILYFISFGVELLLSSLLMLKIKAFSRTTAWLGIFLTIGVFSVFAVIIPELAQIATILNLVSTLIWTIWNILVARTLFHLARRSEVKFAGQIANQ